MTLTEARRLLRKWQERLRLEDWDLTLRWARKDEEEACWGLMIPDTHAKAATIVLVRPSHPAWGTGDHPRDPEATIVHELMHLPMTAFKTRAGSLEEVAEENIVNQVSRLLIALDRRDESFINGGRPLSKVAAIRP